MPPRSRISTQKRSIQGGKTFQIFRHPQQPCRGAREQGKTPIPPFAGAAASHRQLWTDRGPQAQRYSSASAHRRWTRSFQATEASIDFCGSWSVKAASTPTCAASRDRWRCSSPAEDALSLELSGVDLRICSRDWRWLLVFARFTRLKSSQAMEQQCAQTRRTAIDCR